LIGLFIMSLLFIEFMLARLLLIGDIGSILLKSPFCGPFCWYEPGVPGPPWPPP
jgi:hypothetical protein